MILMFSISLGLDDGELKALQRAMLANGTSEICAYWLGSLNEQSAIRTGKLRIHGSEAKDPNLNQFSISELDAAQLIFSCVKSNSMSSVSQRASDFVNC